MDGTPGKFTIRMGFASLPSDQSGQRVFDIKLAGDTVQKDFDIFDAAGGSGSAVVKEFTGISVEKNLMLEFVPRVPNPTIAQAPLINFLEAVRESPKGDH